MSSHPSRSCWTAGEKRYAEQGRGSNPPALRTRRRDPRIAEGRKPQAYIFDQGRKLASPQACVKKSQKAASSQARAQDHTRPQGRKPASTPRRAGKALKSNARPLVGGAGSDSTPQIPTICNIFVDTHNLLLT